jgi:hypothetical protein
MRVRFVRGGPYLSAARVEAPCLDCERLRVLRRARPLQDREPAPPARLRQEGHRARAPYKPDADAPHPYKLDARLSPTPYKPDASRARFRRKGKQVMEQANRLWKRSAFSAGGGAGRV